MSKLLFDARFHNRRGPGGIDLDPSEAVSYFPPLETAPRTTQVIAAGGSVLVGYAGIRFWLRDVEPSVEPGVYFGVVAQCVPRNDQFLDKDQCIGFGPHHVFASRARGDHSNVVPMHRSPA